ncbi:MAG: hypothetical protein KGI83_07675, partial [Verrucomicrobiota bacterium]|nr:hypothetical protein [Verrucomicrobiota bacterium]
MSGIGSLLRKLAGQDNFTGIVRAFIHSAIAAVGPWILIVVTLAMVYIYTNLSVGYVKITNFEAVVIYNFFFSFILSGSLYLTTARYVSDCLYRRDPYPIPGILLSSLLLLLIPTVL